MFLLHLLVFFFFFFNDTATTEIYTLSLHDALPIWSRAVAGQPVNRNRVSITAPFGPPGMRRRPRDDRREDRKSTRLNSSHQIISYAVFCLKKKNKKEKKTQNKVEKQKNNQDNTSNR